MLDWKSIADDVLSREAAALDDQRFDDWIDLFLPDCEYWVPTWIDEETVAHDHTSQISHIYYGNRAGLEDRITRIRSGRSPASTPIHRTSHLFSALVLLGEAQDKQFEVRSSWTNHIYNPHKKNVSVLFGSSIHTLQCVDGQWKIKRKKILIKNDFLPSIVDVYFL